MSEPQVARKRNINHCDPETPSQETEATGAWEPARKRLRTLVRQMRALTLGDLTWSRKAASRPLPPSPAAQHRLHPSPEVAHRRVSAPAGDPDLSTATPGVPVVPEGGGAQESGGQHQETRAPKRHELSECGSAAKKSRSRMRAGTKGVVMTSCYIEQIVYP